MNVPPELLADFPPSADLLLDGARRLVDDGMLAEIAEADYGLDRDAHLAALRPIRDQGIVPAPGPWRPGEVLEPIRWSNPDDPTHKPGSPGRRGHQMRAFACAVLLRVVMEHSSDGVAEARQWVLRRRPWRLDVSDPTGTRTYARPDLTHFSPLLLCFDVLQDGAKIRVTITL